MGFPDHKERSGIQHNRTASETFKCEPLFNLIEEHLKESGQDIVKKAKGTFAFKVTHGPGGKTGHWFIDLKSGSGSIKRDAKEKADVTFIMKDDDLVDMMMGKLQPQTAFFNGKLKVQGKMILATKLQAIIPKNMTVKAKL